MTDGEGINRNKPALRLGGTGVWSYKQAGLRVGFCSLEGFRHQARLINAGTFVRSTILVYEAPYVGEQ